MFWGNRVISIVAIALILSILSIIIFNNSIPDPLSSGRRKSDRVSSVFTVPPSSPAPTDFPDPPDSLGVPGSPGSPGSPASQTTIQRTRYLSWFPHGDFAEQHEAFRNAIKIAHETGRIVIAPLLRLGRPYGWLPFDELAKRYEAQDKTQLKIACTKTDPNLEWRTQHEPCDTIGEWTEIPWSTIFDLDALREEFGIRITERVNGHGWGVHESTFSAQLDYSDVTVVDPLSFANNGTSMDRNPRPTRKPPLRRYINVSELLKVNSRIIQFGSLSSASRFHLTANKKAEELRRALNKRLLLTPDNMDAMRIASDQIANALGGIGAYTTLHLNMFKYISIAKHNNTITPELLSVAERKKIMDSVVLELFGDIPINQAVSSAMPILQPSKLFDLLHNPTTMNRRELLDACVAYRRNKDERFPIFYLVTDLGKRPHSDLDLFGPLLSSFPCIFTIHDMHDWGIIDSQWVSRTDELTDDTIQYEKQLAPILDILMASRGYAFFEIPQTSLTRFIGWQPKNPPLPPAEHPSPL